MTQFFFIHHFANLLMDALWKRNGSKIGQNQEYLMRTVDLILWFGCFLFCIFLVSIWFYLGQNFKAKDTGPDFHNFRKIAEEVDEKEKNPKSIARFFLL